MPVLALTHVPPDTLADGERTHVRRTPIDMARARAQHDAYRATLSDCGATVRVIAANRAFPDSVFIEDAALVLPEVAILTRPGAPSRRAEPDALAPVLEPFRTLRRIEAPGTLDGGDVVVVGQRIFVGMSSRSNADGARSLAELTHAHGYRVEPIAIHDCLHLKSACCPLPDGRLLVNPGWVDLASFDALTTIAIPPEEPFAADVALVHDTVVMSTTHARTAEFVASLGFSVRATPLSEFEKAEGGATCLSLIFDDAPRFR